jgi:hypothetical protein
MLNGVTFTGADDSVAVKELVAISAEYPGVEWGILFSKRGQGGWRFPSEAWVERLQERKTRDMKLAAHLCGGWVRDLVMEGNFSWQEQAWVGMFQRVQLNFHGEEHGTLAGLETVLATGRDLKPFILQCDGVHDAFVRSQVERRPEQVAPLFDVSGGAGVLPQEWPRAWPAVRCGYAGGLGPENVVEQLQRIEEASGGQPYWIDMERRIRSEDDSQFDLKAVERVLKALKWGQD